MRANERSLFLAVLGLLCACSGGGSNVTSTAIPSGEAAGNARSVRLGLQPTSAALPAISQITGTLVFPAVRTPATIELGASATAPAGVASQHVKGVQSGGTLIVYEYVTIVSPVSLTLPSIPAITLNFPSSISLAGKSFSYGISDLDARGGLVSFNTQGPGTIDGQTVSFAQVPVAITFAARHAYTFVLYATMCSERCSADAGAVTEYSHGITQGVDAITAGPDGNLWFTGTSGSIGRITTGGVVTEFPTRSNALAPASGITTGPDGNLWFTENLGPSFGGVGKITPAGVVTEYANTPYLTPNRDITTARDGNLWYPQTDSTGNVGGFGVTTTSGAYQPIILQGSFVPQQSVALGSDGNLWFTGYDFALGTWGIGRISTTGRLTEYTVGIAPGAVLLGIVAGPGRRVWFTESQTDRIGAIATDGSVTEYVAGITPHAGPSAITAGPDGNLWFTESQIDRIAKITPNGFVTEYSKGITSGAGLTGIAAGPDGDLWFTEAGLGRIGKIQP